MKDAGLFWAGFILIKVCLLATIGLLYSLLLLASI